MLAADKPDIIPYEESDPCSRVITMIRTEWRQGVEARSDEPPVLYYLFMCSGAHVIVIDVAEQHRFVFGELAVMGVAALALSAAMLIQAL